MTNLLKLTLFFLVLPCVAWGQTVKADILSTSKVTLGESADEVRFMPEKLVSVDTSNPLDIKTYIEPKIEFDKWNKENTLSLSIPSVEGYTDKTVDEKTGEVVMRNKTEGFYFRKPTDSNDIVKFGLILYEIPDKPKIVTIDGVEKYQWRFAFEGTSGLTQIKRPPLIKDNGDGTKTFSSDGGTGEHENSQRFYRTIQVPATNPLGEEIVIDQLEHGFTFLRPRFIDAKENVIWADLEIQGTDYIVTVDKKWIDNAVYPVKANDSVTYQEGTDSYTGCLDTMGQEYRPTTNLSTLTTIEATWFGDTDRSNTFIKWDLSALSGSTISAVSIIFNTYSASGSNTISCYRLLRNWVVGQATWNVYSTGNNWSTAGGAYNDSDRSSTLSASITDSTSSGEKTWTSAQLVTDVQGFVSGTYPNYGWVFTSDDTGDSRYHAYISSEYSTVAYRPKIIITYTAGGGETPSRRRIIIISKYETNHTAGNTDTGYTDLAVCPARRKAEALA